VSHSPRHAFAFVLCWVSVNNSLPYLLESEHYNGTWFWFLQASTEYGTKIGQDEIVKKLPDGIGIDELATRWSMLPSPTPGSRERQNLLTLDFQLNYGVYDVAKHLGYPNALRSLPPLRWYYDFDEWQWIPEVSPVTMRQGAEYQQIAELLEPISALKR
jgi:hypothetical protein